MTSLNNPKVKQVCDFFYRQNSNIQNSIKDMLTNLKNYSIDLGNNSNQMSLYTKLTLLQQEYNRILKETENKLNQKYLGFISRTFLGNTKQRHQNTINDVTTKLQKINEYETFVNQIYELYTKNNRWETLQNTSGYDNDNLDIDIFLTVIDECALQNLPSVQNGKYSNFEIQDPKSYQYAGRKTLKKRTKKPRKSLKKKPKPLKKKSRKYRK
jgi:hypothetical protein